MPSYFKDSALNKMVTEYEAERGKMAALDKLKKKKVDKADVDTLVVHKEELVVHAPKLVVHAETDGSSRHGSYADEEARKAYRREWAKKKRAERKAKENLC